MSSVRERYTRLMASGNGTERLEFFSDAVFAIAMTLLVIDLRPPDTEGMTATEIIVGAAPGFFAYALSFVIIAINWISHHRRFRVIVRHDARLMQINLLLLFLITFLPFPTSVLAEYNTEFASVALYAFVVGALSLVQLVMWWYARRADLMSPEVDPALFRYVSFALLPVPIVFWLSIPLALLSPVAAIVSWVLLGPVNWLLRWIESRRHKEDLA